MSLVPAGRHDSKVFCPTRQELQDALSLSYRDHFRKAYLLPAVDAGLIEMARPDKPNSRTQRYRLTLAGKELRRRRGMRR